MSRLEGLPEVLRGWVDEPGSLTRRLRRACDAGLRVQVCREAWQRPWRDEARRLGIPTTRQVWLREVLLCNGAKPWVHARSVMPPALLAGRLRRLRGLGSQPLGRVLFGGVPLTRGAIEIARLQPDTGLFELTARRVTIQQRCLWARRSVFRAGVQRLLVTEVFLPECYGAALGG